MVTAKRPDEWILSIHEDSNANATLFHHGTPVFAVAEERLTRVRFAAGFPKHAVQACLDFAGIELDDVDVVVAGNQTHFLPRLTPNLVQDGDHDYFGLAHKAYLYFQGALASVRPLGWIAQWLGREPLRRKVPRLAPFVDHHTAHAYSAYLTSGMENAVAITSDNMGDGYSSKVFSCADGRCSFLYGSPAHQSPGQFYGEVAQFLGYHNLMAGKVTGLASYGDPEPGYPYMERLFQLHPSKERFHLPELLLRRKRKGPYRELAALEPRDVAAAAQKRLEDVMVAYVEHAIKRTGHSNVVLAGGTFANVVLNQRILDLEGVENIYVHPAMTDQGISMGAGLAYLGEQGLATNQPLPNIYLGPGFSEEEIVAALHAAELDFERPDDPAAAIADVLCDGKVVGHYHGRMEYGLRALGNRSIFYRPDDPAVNDWLNERLQRSEFMPFAPVVLEEEAATCFHRVDGGILAGRYMTMTFDAQPGFQEKAPGVVHIDGTARPQFISREANARTYDIIRHFFERTGIPCLVNTSFNMHSEPIVCTPENAIDAFRQSRLDILAIGPFIVRQPTD